jgi:hypothetical protein
LLASARPPETLHVRLDNSDYPDQDYLDCRPTLEPQQHPRVRQADNRLYNCHDTQRAGIAVKDIAAIDQILDNGDWTDRETAQQTFKSITDRGTALAERMR